MLSSSVYRNSADDLTIYVGLKYDLLMFHGKWGLEEDWMPVKVFTFHPLFFPSGKSGPQYSPIPLIAHSSVLDLLSLRRFNLHTDKF
jgi:hypothetical protein